MNKEMLDIVNDLSKKPTTELALQIMELAGENLILEQENKKCKEVIDKAREYLTSYSSIHTIQFGTENDSLNDIELNKTLDEKTLNEMTNRYLKVHDKLLEILKEV